MIRFVYKFSLWIAFAYSTLSPLFADSRVNGILVWELQKKQTKLLLPKIEGLRPEQIASQYLEKLNHSKDYSSLLKGYEDQKLKEQGEFSGVTRGFSEFRSNEKTVGTPVAIIANRPGHMTLNDPFFANIIHSFVAAGAVPYVVPLGLDTLLSLEQLEEYHSFLARSFPALLAVGGGDIDPRVYRQENKYSTNPVLKRDEIELKLIKKYLQSKTGAFYGICRGHQAYGVAIGGELNQDLSLQKHSKELHGIPNYFNDGTLRSAWHSVRLVDEQNALFDALKETEFRVNSRHHQAIRPESIPRKQGRKIIAVEGKGNDAVVEAIEEKDESGRTWVLTVQFHPEDMHTGGGTLADATRAKKIMKWMVDNAKKFAQELK
jgi:putative glutamine amidotransferase